MRALLPFVLVWCSVIVSTPAAPEPSHRLFVSNERSGDVSVIDSAAQSVVVTVPVGKRPRGISLSPDGTRIYVAVSGSPRLGPGADPERARNAKADKSADGIAVLDRASLQLQRKFSVGSDPETFALSREGRKIFVSNEDEATASCWEIDSGKNVFRTRVSDEPEGVALHPTRDELYVTCEDRGELFVLDAASGKVLARLELGGRPRTIAFSPGGDTAYVPLETKPAVALIDTTSRALQHTIPIHGSGALPMCAVASPDGREVFVSTGRGNTVAVLDVSTRAHVASIAVGSRPWGIVLSPDATLLYSANGASDDVSVVDVRARKEIKRIKVGAGPWGIAVASH
jgi:YVTN family beta-propeller protein